MIIPSDEDRAKMQTVTLWEHNAGDCDLGVQYHGNGSVWRYEMRMGNEVIPLSPEFPMGFVLAAHCLLHMCEDLFSGSLSQDNTGDKPEHPVKNLLEGWEYDQEKTDGF